MEEQPRCQFCIWSGNADIPTAFVVVDCGRHREGDTQGATFTTKMRTAMNEWADRLTMLVNDELAPHYRQVVTLTIEEAVDHAALDHESNMVATGAPLTTRELRSLAALLDEAAERIRAYEADVRDLRAQLKDVEIELNKLRARARR